MCTEHRKCYVYSTFWLSPSRLGRTPRHQNRCDNPDITSQLSNCLDSVFDLPRWRSQSPFRRKCVGSRPFPERPSPVTCPGPQQPRPLGVSPPPPPHSNPFRTKMWSHRTLALAGRRLGRGGASSSVAGWWWCSSSSSSSSSLVSSSLRQGTSRTRTTVLPALLQSTHLGTIPFRGFSAAAASSTSVESDVLERDVLPYDVVVVGGGPAGLATAIRFKQLCTQHNRDLSVCVLDKGRCV